MTRAAHHTMVWALLSALMIAIPVSADAQGTQATATTVAAAPVYASRDASQAPLRVAREGSVLLLLDVDGEWCRVEFQDPEFGRRTGYVQMKYVRLEGNPATGNARPTAPSGTQGSSQGFIFTDDKSHSSGFFLGGGLEGNGIVSTEGGFASAADSGPGLGLVVGYGFSPRWSLYGQLSGASMTTDTIEDAYALGHFDLGTRIHFLAGEHRVVPFVQLALSSRAIAADVLVGLRVRRFEAFGVGAGFGGGLNAHFTPKVAFSAAVAWSVGNFSRYEVDGVEVANNSYSASSARVHLGLVWFPSAP